MLKILWHYDLNNIIYLELEPSEVIKVCLKIAHRKIELKILRIQNKTEIQKHFDFLSIAKRKESEITTNPNKKTWNFLR